MTKSSRALCFFCQHREKCIPQGLIPTMEEKTNQRVVENLSEQISLEPNEILYSQGDPFRSIYSIRSGCIKTYSVDENGNELIEGLFYPGEFLSLDCISFKRYSHFAVAKGSTHVCIFNYHQLENLSSTQPKVALHISKAISSQLSRQLRWSQIMSKGDLKEKLVAWIFFVSSKLEILSESYEFSIPITHAEIAKMLQMRPESLSRAIKKLNEEGNIYFNNKYCEVKNRNQLFHDLPDSIRI